MIHIVVAYLLLLFPRDFETRAQKASRLATFAAPFVAFALIWCWSRGWL